MECIPDPAQYIVGSSVPHVVKGLRISQGAYLIMTWAVRTMTSMHWGETQKEPGKQLNVQVTLIHTVTHRDTREPTKHPFRPE